MDETPLIHWPCYEPAGQSVTLTEAELVQHVLVIGSTGCGKTTLLTHALRQLIPRGIGLLLQDAKCEGAVEQVRAVARSCGREADVVVLGPEGTHALDLFGPLKRLDDVERLTQRLLSATDPVGSDNLYWQTTTAAMISSALTLLLCRRKPVRFAEALDFMRRWFVEGSAALPPAVATVVDRVKQSAQHKEAPPQMLSALDYVQIWRQLDPRTRSNLQSCLLNVLRPLSSSLAVGCLEPHLRPAFDPALVAQGKVCVVSCNALTQPELSRFLQRLARRMCFDAVQSRGMGKHPLCGLIADEFPLLVEPEDADQLATLRSKRCFVLAATQGLGSLEDRLGPRLCRAVLANFNTLVFLRTREPEANEFATVSLGMRKPKEERPDHWVDSVVKQLSRPSEFRMGPVCPPGGLGRLQAHQGYVVKSDGTVTPEPVWFAPWFELQTDEPKRTPPVGGDGDHMAAQHLELLMEQNGFQPLHSPTVIAAAWKLTRRSHRRALKLATDFFRAKAILVPRGLETLPTPWLLGLPGIFWSLRASYWIGLPWRIQRMACVRGLLLMQFARESQPPDARLSAWNELRVAVNARLYPGRWRPLKRHHRHLLGQHHPGLRRELVREPPEL
jgi:energy-coupling factor transporter ATP-binding protein EcfA2